ncbi:MAG TPA: iron ABC transporter permease [Marmoricola sp.]
MRLLRRVPLVLVVLVPLAAIGVFFVLPFVGMIHRGLWPAGHLDIGATLDVLGRSRTRSVLWFTAYSAALSTAGAVLLGVPAAYCCYRLRFPGRDLVRTLALVPFVMPTVVVGVAFNRLFADGEPFAWLGSEQGPTAIVAAMVFMNVGVVMRTVGSAWAGMDVRRAQAAAVLGASPAQVWWTVTLPALAPVVVAAASVVFLFCATSFGIVLVLGGLRYANVESEIYLLTTQELDLGSAAALSILQLLLIVALLWLVGRVRRQQVDHAVAAARTPALRDLPVLGVGVATFGYLLLPVLTLVSASLHRDGGWSWGNYRALATTGDDTLVVPATQALANSLVIAVEATAMAMCLGAMVAYIVSRRPADPRLARLIAVFDGLFMLPLGVSAVTVGFGFLITLDRPPLDLRSSSVLIPIAQAMVALPLVVRTVAPVWRGIDDRLRQAAASLGAGRWRVFASVDLAIGWRPLLAAAGFGFAVSLGEFGATSFLARSDHPTLPVVIYRLLGHPGVNNFGMAMAASTVLAAATAGTIVLVERLRVGSLGALG